MVSFFGKVITGLLLAGLMVGVGSGGEQSTPADARKEANLQREARMKWWRDARFGLFIHWGPVSLKGTEISWSRGGKRGDWVDKGGGPAPGKIPAEIYDNLYKEFNPVKFDAEEWIEIAKSAGMKYLVFTTKHHDGFTMFDSKLTGYKITSPESPFRRDIVAELAEACHKGGVALGFYYSGGDWHHPDYKTDNHARYIKYAHGQLEELCSNYGKVAIIWFDGHPGEPEKLNKTICRLQPDLIMNSGDPRSGFRICEMRIGDFNLVQPWETCATLCGSWSWRPKARMRSLKNCLQTLVRVAGGDGNFLLNVGPMPDGRIEPRQVQRLREIGQWLKKYGQTIYATRGGPFKPCSGCVSTRKDNRIYVHILDWSNKEFILPAIDKKIVRSSLLTGGQMNLKQTPEAITVTVAKQYRRDMDTIVMLELDGAACEIAPLDVHSGSLAYRKKARASNVKENSPKHGPENAFDDDLTTSWTSKPNTKQAWLEVDLGKPHTICRAVICEKYAYYGIGVREYELQNKVDGKWHTFYRGDRIYAQVVLTFKPLTTQHIRLNILRSSSSPSIREFQLFGQHPTLKGRGG